MGFDRSWVVHDNDKGAEPRSIPRRTSRGGTLRFNRSRYGVEPAEDRGHRRTKVRFDQIVPDPDVVQCPRVNLGDPSKRARSIMNKGLETPLLVWLHDGEYYLVDGYRRYEALERVKATNRLFFRKFFEEVDVEIVEGTLKEVLVAQARANLRERTWTDADFANACASLVAAGLTSFEIATKLGQTTSRVLDALEFKQGATTGLLKAVADGFSYDKALDLATKPEELQDLLVDAFRQGKPEKREPGRPVEKSVLSGPIKLKPTRKTVPQIGEALDRIEKHLQEEVNDEMATLHAMEAASTRSTGTDAYLLRRTRKINELRGMRHALLFALGRRPDLLEVEDPVHNYKRGRHGQWFKMPSWRDER